MNYFIIIFIIICAQVYNLCTAGNVPTVAIAPTPSTGDQPTAKQRRISVESVDTDTDAGGEIKQRGKGKQKAKKEEIKEEPPSLDATDPQIERRAARVVAEDNLKYSSDTVARCPLPGCDSKGTDQVDAYLLYLVLSDNI